MINGSDLLMYNQMEQHQAELLREAQGLHRARKAVLAARPPRTDGKREPQAVDHGGFAWASDGSRPRSARALRAAAGTPPRPGRRGSTPLRRFAARFGSGLVAVGRRLERIDRS